MGGYSDQLSMKHSSDHWLQKISGLFVPKPLLFARGYPCCCSRCPVCTLESFPTQLSIVIAGIVEGTCGSCASLNDTYVLDFIGYFNPYCRWRYDFPVTVCGVNHITFGMRITVAHTSTSIQVDLDSDLYTNVSAYFKDDVGIAAPRDCQFSNKDIPWDWDGLAYTCDGSNSTCTVTAI